MKTIHITTDNLPVDDLKELQDCDYWILDQLCSLVVYLDCELRMGGDLIKLWEEADDLEVFLNKFYLDDVKSTLKDYLLD